MVEKQARKVADLDRRIEDLKQERERAFRALVIGVIDAAEDSVTEKDIRAGLKLVGFDLDAKVLYALLKNLSEGNLVRREGLHYVAIRPGVTRQVRESSRRGSS